MNVCHARDFENVHFKRFSKPHEFREPNRIVRISSWAEVCEYFVLWLLKHGYLCTHELPVPNHSGRGKSFISPERRHECVSYGAEWRKVGAFFVDTKYDAEHTRMNIVSTMKRLGVKNPDFTICVKDPSVKAAHGTGETQHVGWGEQLLANPNNVVHQRWASPGPSPGSAQPTTSGASRR